MDMVPNSVTLPAPDPTSSVSSTTRFISLMPVTYSDANPPPTSTAQAGSAAQVPIITVSVLTTVFGFLAITVVLIRWASHGPPWRGLRKRSRSKRSRKTQFTSSRSDLSTTCSSPFDFRDRSDIEKSTSFETFPYSKPLDSNLSLSTYVEPSVGKKPGQKCSLAKAQISFISIPERALTTGTINGGVGLAELDDVIFENALPAHPPRPYRGVFDVRRDLT